MFEMLFKIPTEMNADLEVLMKESGENKTVLIRRIIREYIDNEINKRVGR